MNGTLSKLYQRKRIYMRSFRVTIFGGVIHKNIYTRTAINALKNAVQSTVHRAQSIQQITFYAVYSTAIFEGNRHDHKRVACCSCV